MPDFNEASAASDHDEPRSVPLQREPAKSNRRAGRSDRSETSTPNQAAAKLLTVTINAETGEVVRLESIDASGAHNQLSTEEKATLLAGGSDVEELMAEAFEAGIACVLGDDAGLDPSSDESAEDAELRHRLLAPLIERSAVRRMTERAVLNRAIVGTLIEGSAS